MASLFHSLVLVIAGSTQREIARQVRYLKIENEILRSKLPARITVTLNERLRLLKFGAKPGRAIRQLVRLSDRTRSGAGFGKTDGRRRRASGFTEADGLPAGS